MVTFNAAVAARVAITSPSDALRPCLAVGGICNVSFCSSLSSLSDDFSPVLLDGMANNFSSSLDLEPLLCVDEDKLRPTTGLLEGIKDAPVSILPLLTLDGFGTPNKLLILELAGFAERKSGKCDRSFLLSLFSPIAIDPLLFAL